MSHSDEQALDHSSFFQVGIGTTHPHGGTSTMLLSVKLHLKHLLCQYQPPQDAEAETWPPFLSPTVSLCPVCKVGRHGPFRGGGGDSREGHPAVL